MMAWAEVVLQAVVIKRHRNAVKLNRLYLQGKL